eukprot:ANDGO_03300.mRNA.1 hypothetical protein
MTQKPDRSAILKVFLSELRDVCKQCSASDAGAAAGGTTATAYVEPYPGRIYSRFWIEGFVVSRTTRSAKFDILELDDGSPARMHIAVNPSCSTLGDPRFQPGAYIAAVVRPILNAKQLGSPVLAVRVGLVEPFAVGTRLTCWPLEVAYCRRLVKAGNTDSAIP